MIKIVYVIDIIDTDQAGTENQLIKIINQLDKKLFDIKLVCFKPHPWLDKNIDKINCQINVFHISSFKDIKSYYNIYSFIRYLKKIKPDIVHTFFPVANIIGVISARIAKVKFIYSSRRDYGEWMKQHYLFATKIANKYVDRIIVNSHPVKKLTIEKECVDKNKIIVVFNGIELERYTNIKMDINLKKRLNIPRASKIVIKVANFRPMKHHFTLIKAANEILKTKNDIYFILIGSDILDGGMLNQTIELVNELQIDNYIYFVGQQDVLPYLSIADVGVNCSEGEGLSNAIIEYMTSKIPCVVSNAGGNPDLITHMHNGLLFALDDYHALAKQIIFILNEDTMRNKFISNSYEKVKNELSIDAMIEKYSEIYLNDI